jgi:hypothetical protein
MQLVSEVEEKENQGSAQMEWLYSQDLVGKLIGKLDPAQDSDVHANSAVALVGFISQQQQMHWSASLPSAQSRFTASLVDSESVRALLQKLLSGSPSTLEHGLTVLVELVRHSTSAARAAHGSSSAVVVEVLNRMGDLVEVLRSPPATPAIINTTGAPPLVCAIPPPPSCLPLVTTAGCALHSCWHDACKDAPARDGAEKHGRTLRAVAGCVSRLVPAAAPRASLCGRRTWRL